MNIDYLRYIVTIEKVKSINKAAKALYMTQPTLSRIVQSIENDMGIQIFVRNSRGVETTHDGQQFINRIKSLVDEFDQIEEDYFNINHAPKNEVTLFVGSHRSSPAVEALIRFYDNSNSKTRNVNVIFQEGTESYITDSIYHNVIDLGIVHYLNNQEGEFQRRCDDLNLTYHLINESSVCAQISSTHPLAQEAEITEEMLRPYPHITFNDEDLTGINYCSDISQYNRHLQGKRIVVNDRGTLRSLIQKTDGYYLGNYAKCNLNDHENMVYVPIKDCQYTIKTVSVYNKDHILSAEEREFLDYIEAIYDEQCRKI